MCAMIQNLRGKTVKTAQGNLDEQLSDSAMRASVTRFQRCCTAVRSFSALHVCVGCDNIHTYVHICVFTCLCAYMYTHIHTRVQ